MTTRLGDRGHRPEPSRGLPRDPGILEGDASTRPGRRTLSAAEDAFTRADGSVQWLRWELRAPARWPTGTVGGIVLFSEDDPRSASWPRQEPPERTANEELERFNRAAIDRELRGGSESLQRRGQWLAQAPARRPPYDPLPSSPSCLASRGK